jgi:capsule polysaccharide modification protein KpsS
MFRPLITTLAEYQSRFWLPVGLRLRELGHEPAFLSFDDRSTEMIKSSGLKVFNAIQTNGAPRGDDPVIDSLFASFGIDQINFWTAHERFAFGRRDSVEMRSKLALSIIAANRACAEWSSGGPTVMVQELGGFLSVIGSFHAARTNGMHNWFIEPSFFRGRMFFVKNSFAAKKISFSDDPCEIPLGLDEYLEETVRSGSIVVPQKDRHQYTTARKKIVNWRNLQRLIQKLTDKHVLGKQQEFGYIGNHIRTHVQMLLNSRRLKYHYTPLDRLGRFIYYPLHVPGDMALTLRSPHLLDQLALIDYICRSVPSTHRVVIKEHPAMVGAVNAKRLIELLNRFDNLALLPPSTNNYQVLGRSDVVVSVNSKSGAEAGLLGKPVLVLGDAFYNESPFATQVNRIQDLPIKILQSLSPERRQVPFSSVRRYFADVWNVTFPGELYFNEPTNVETFVQSMLAGMYFGSSLLPVGKVG